ncbi:MAG: cysteine--tRNA ligase [Candidatus Omnitrophica bacterium]|nr:cysteine--tRNA ligase [Candidatus Omnitrophota bacterium]
MALRLYNTLSRALEDVQPRNPPKVGIYVCGPTVYDEPHIGHARSAFVFDVLRRHLLYKKHEVTFVRNVTDVDDKIIEKTKQEVTKSPGHKVTGDLNAACREVSERYLASYHAAMDRLGIGRPDIEPRATEHVVPDMTDCIARLLVQGAAYEAGGDVYFAVRKWPGYGKLSNRTPDELKAGARVEPGERKQDPLDFALWKAAKPGEPSWESPWGRGRPGWHIECSVMSMKYLGDAFDLHGGGLDLVFPHHENEIAQAEAAGKPFARQWVHHGLLTVNGEKMSKSLGNFVTVEQALADAPHPDYLKLFFLKTQYRSPIDYAPAKMAEARKNWQEFSRFFQHYDQRRGPATSGREVKSRLPNLLEAFNEAMDDDLNTPRAVAVLFELVNLGHQALESPGAEAAALADYVHVTLLECGMTLGLFLQGTSEEPPEALERILARIAERDAARKAKGFQRADAIRRELQQEGILLSDTPNGTFWRRAQ